MIGVLNVLQANIVPTLVWNYHLEIAMVASTAEQALH